MSRRRLGLFNKPSGGGGFLLDTYSNAVSAYSLRKLKTGVTYGIRIRRDSDDAQTNVELYDSGSIDLSSTVSAGGNLGTWIGSNNGFVDLWYDQAGLRNAIQLTKSIQPQIISSGTMITDNGVAALQTTGTQYMVATVISLEETFSLFTIFSTSNLSSFQLLVSEASNSGTDGRFYFGHNAGTLYTRAGGTIGTDSGNISSDTIATNNLHSIFADGSSLYYALNGSAISGGTAFNNTGVLNQGLNLFNNVSGGTLKWEGKSNEIIIFSDDKTSDKSGIETDINNYYSIF